MAGIAVERAGLSARDPIDPIGPVVALPLGAVSLLGGLIGGWLLVRTSDHAFLRLLPWLMLAAALVFTFGDRLEARASTAALRIRLLWPFQFLVAIYGGYFGGGMGIMMLAALAVAGIRDIHEMNGVKAVLGLTINGVALLEFVATGTLAWRYGLVMVAGGMVGGFSARLWPGARSAKRPHVRRRRRHGR